MPSPFFLERLIAWGDGAACARTGFCCAAGGVGSFRRANWLRTTRRIRAKKRDPIEVEVEVAVVAVAVVAVAVAVAVAAAVAVAGLTLQRESIAESNSAIWKRP